MLDEQEFKTLLRYEREAKEKLVEALKNEKYKKFYEADTNKDDALSFDEWKTEYQKTKPDTSD